VRLRFSSNYQIQSDWLWNLSAHATSPEPISYVAETLGASLVPNPLYKP
jgi:hypothetical protein